MKGLLTPLVSLRRLSIGIISLLLVIVPFQVNTRVAASPAMGDINHMFGMNCETYCAQRGGMGSIAQPVVLKEDETQVPDPIRYLEPTTQVMISPEGHGVPRALVPQGKFTTSPLRPPDLVISLAVLRI